MRRGAAVCFNGLLAGAPVRRRQSTVASVSLIDGKAENVACVQVNGETAAGALESDVTGPGWRRAKINEKLMVRRGLDGEGASSGYALLATRVDEIDMARGRSRVATPGDLAPPIADRPLLNEEIGMAGGGRLEKQTACAKCAEGDLPAELGMGCKVDFEISTDRSLKHDLVRSDEGTSPFG